MQTYFSDKERYELFKNELNLIKDKNLKDFVRFVLCNDLKSNFFYLPSSSTGKYHNPSSGQWLSRIGKTY